MLEISYTGFPIKRYWGCEIKKKLQRQGIKVTGTFIIRDKLHHLSLQFFTAPCETQYVACLSWVLIETDEQDFLHDKATSLFDLIETVKTSKSVFVNLTKKKSCFHSVMEFEKNGENQKYNSNRNPCWKGLKLKLWIFMY